MGEIFIVLGALLFFLIRAIVISYKKDVRQMEMEARGVDEKRWIDLSFSTREDLNEIYKEHTGKDFDWETCPYALPRHECAYQILKMEGKDTMTPPLWHQPLPKRREYR